MPDVSLNGIEFEIKGSTDAASSSIDNLIGKLGALNNALSEVANIKKLATGLNSLKKAIDNLNSADLDKIKASLESFGQVSESLSGLSSMSKDLASFMRALAKLAESPENVLDLAQALNILGSVDLTNLQNAEGALRALADALATAGRKSTAAKAVRDVGKEAEKANTPLSNFLASIKRIAFYRILRGILKSISQGFREGLVNAYQFSKLNGGDLAASLDLIATKSLTMKNQLGAAFGALLNAIAPVVVTIISLVTRLANALSMLFSAIGGGTQYKKAKDAWTDWGDAAAGAGGAAKEALRYLAPFDELNRLPDDNKGGGGGGSAIDPDDMFEYKDLPEWLQNFANKLQELAASLKITFNDVFFDWSNLTGEQIAEKAITGLGALLGAGVGFLIGGVPGAIVGTLVGTTVGLMVSSLIFDHDGTISRSEIANMVSLGLSGLCGGVLGFVVGGPGGALLGATVGIGLWGALKEAEFFSDGEVGNLTSQLATALTALTGAVVGFKVGGPGGALIGATVGLGLAMAISAVTFDGDAHPGYKSGLDWFVIEVLGLPSDQELKDWGKTAIEWVGDGIEEAINETSLAFTGMSAEEFGKWIENSSTLLNGWLSDIPAKAKNAGIKFINSLVDPIVNGLNSFIEDHPDISDYLGLKPINFQLIPEIPQEELTKNYDEAKRIVEENSKSHPVGVAVGLIPKPNENGELFDLSDLEKKPIEIPSTANFTGWEVKGSKDKSSVKAFTTWSSTANWKDWEVYGSKNASTVDKFTTWGSTADWNNWSVYGSKSSSSVSKFTTWSSTADWKDWKVYGSKSSSNVNSFTTWDSTANWNRQTIGNSWGGTTWNSTAKFTGYAIESSLQDSDGRLKVNGTFNIVKLTGNKNIDQVKAGGGVYTGGGWKPVQSFAGGGSPFGGQIFRARENGNPELVGTLRGSTAVMNNDQIVASVSSGVARAIAGIHFQMTGLSASAPAMEESANEDTMYRAFRRALDETDFGKDISIDGEPIYQSVVRRNRQNTRATGVNQLAMA